MNKPQILRVTNWEKYKLSRQSVIKHRKDGLLWIPVYVDAWLLGSIHFELEPDEQATFLDLLLLAAYDDGYIRANEEMPYSVRFLAGYFNKTEELIERTIKKCLRPEIDKLRIVPLQNCQPPLQSSQPPLQKCSPRVEKSREEKNREEKNNDGAKNAPSMFDYQMTILLRRHVESYKGTKRKTKAELLKWVNSFRLMRERDKLEPRDIKRWLLWAIGDEFWRGNTLSAAKFRQRVQEGKIQAAIVRELKQRDKGKEPSEDLQERDRISAKRSRAEATRRRREEEASEREVNRLAEVRKSDPVKWAKCVLVGRDISEEGLQKLLKSQFILGFHREAVKILLQEITKTAEIGGKEKP